MELSVKWPRCFSWILEQITRYKRRLVNNSVLNSLEEAKQLKELVVKQTCLGCGQSTLIINQFVRGPNGWEARIECTNCNFTAVINSTGFDFMKINSKGKARE